MDPGVRRGDGGFNVAALREPGSLTKNNIPTEVASFQWINDKQARYHAYTQ
jgi:hypothetical protein